MSKRKFVENNPIKFEFDDLSEDVTTVIIGLLTQKERLAYERINRKVGRSCGSLWNQQKSLGREITNCARRFEIVLKCPNLVKFDGFYESIGCWRGPFEFTYRKIKLLAEKCPRIEHFEDISLNFILDYFNYLDGSNHIKYIRVHILYEAGKASLTAMLKFPFEKLQHLQVISVGIIHRDPMRINIMKKLMSLDIKEVHMNYFWKDILNPGDKLTILEDVDGEDLPKDLSQKHPKLREIKSYIDGTVDNFRILNGLPLLTRVNLWLKLADWKTIRPLFQSFLSTHIKMVQMEVHVEYEHLNDFLHDITTRKRELRVLHLWSHSENRTQNQTNDWNLFMNMSKLRKLYLRFFVENQIPDLEIFYDSLPKLTNFFCHTNCVASSAETTEKYLKKHPERSIEALFRQY